MKPKIFYLEDDATLAFLTKDNLEEKGFEVVHCLSGKDAFEIFIGTGFDLCILDIMLPEVDGFTIAKLIRQKNPHIPILFLSAKSLKEDKLEGFKLGGDDYILKPFSIEELVCRINVFLKRNNTDSLIKREDLKLGSFTFQYSSLSLSLEDTQISLTKREADLLHLFIENMNKIVTREEILKKLWGDDDYFMGRSLDVFVSRLRKLFKADPNIQLENVHGVGFRLKVD